MRGWLEGNRDATIVLGAGFVVLGAWLLHQAYDAQGESRPFLLKLLPA